MGKENRLIASAVLFLHCLLIGTLLIFDQMAFLPKSDPFKKKQLLVTEKKQLSKEVKGIAAAPPLKSEVNAVDKAVAKVKKEVEPAKTIQPEKKLPEKVIQTAKGKNQKVNNIKEKVEPAKKEGKNEKSEKIKALAQQAKETIAKIPLERATISQPEYHPLAAIGEKQEVSLHSAEGAAESSYGEELAAFLQKQLTLPEWGKVVVRLKINRKGTILEVVILNSESEKNRIYLEKNLPRALAAPFGVKFTGEDARTFTVVLNHQ